MQSLRRFRKFVVLAGLVWLPMSVFAQVCATQCMLMSMQSSGVLSHVVNSQSATQATVSNAVVSGDAKSNFVSADSDDHDCDMKAVCAFAAMTPLIGDQHDLVASVASEPIPIVGFHFASYRSIADTPPPRTLL